MKKYFEKHETLFSILLIIIYLVTNSFCLNNYGSKDFRTMLLNIVLSVLIIIFILKNNLVKYYSLDKFPSPKKYLYFIPLVILMTVNLWGKISINATPTETIYYMISMLFVGFLEEIIFRGFLFKMMAKDNLKSAIIVTSVTFGIGHILNLFNGADLIPTIMQIMYALAAGYLFAIILVKSKSLWPCIITHSVVNALSIFSTKNFITTYIAPIALIVISLTYAFYINKKID